jgi:hypothetical protein
MDPRTIARGLAFGRLAIGAALIAAPAKAASRWVGEHSENPGAQVALTSVGSRDFVLGAGILWSLAGRSPVHPWMVASAISDTVDLAATLRFRNALPSSGVIGVGALAGGSAALGFWLQGAMD